MSFNGQLLATGGVAECLTDSVQVFGADGTYSSNKLLYQFENNVTNTVGLPSATNSGATFSSSTVKLGSYSAEFAGTTQHIQTNYSENDTSLTHSFWMYQQSISGSYNGILGNYWNGGSGVYGYYLWSNNGTALKWRVHTSNSASVEVTGTISLNAWHHVVITWSDTVGAAIYIDGVLAQFTASSLSRQQNSQEIALGNIDARATSSAGYDGFLDQYRYYNRAVSASEAQTLYAETNATTSNTNLFNEGAGIALYTMDYDASDAGGLYNGTPSNVVFGVGGQINTAALLNGSAVAADISLGSSFISAFDVPNKSFSLWFNWDGSNPGSNGYGMPFFMNGSGISNGRIGVQITNSNGTLTAFSGTSASAPTTTISANTWYHFALVVSGSNYEAFVNGNSIGSTTTDTYVDSGTDNATIGSWFNSNYYFTGDVDQVRFFSKALNQSEINTLANETACNYTCTTDTVNYPGTTNLAYYKLDNSADDETGVYDGASTDVLYTFGRFGQAAVFNGSSSKIVLPSIDWTTITISFWINARSDSEGGNRNNVASDGTINRNCIFINKDYIQDGRVPENSISYFDNSYANSVSATWEDDTWIHIVVTLSGQDMAIYKNGILADSATISGRPTGNKTYNWGKNGTSFFTGNLDQIRLFASVLSADKITELYNEKPCADTSNFKATLYDGNSNSAGQYVSNVGFQPDLTWIKYTNANIRHLITDSITGPSVYEGAGITTHSNETFVSNTYGEFTSFDANGFIVRFWSGSQYFNTSGYDYVAWNWKGGGAAVLNQNGGTNSQVSANTAAGFSIVNWSGDNSTTTIGHGLNSPPEVVIRKNLGTSDWAFDTTAIDGSFDYLFLNTTAQKADHTSLSAPTSTVFSTSGTAFNSSSMIAYCWHSVAGYSKIGSYPGNGTTSNTVSAPSFEPSFVMIKRTDSTSNWRIYDNARGTNVELYANSSSQDVSATGYINFNSNGFEITTTGAWLNANGGTYLYMAFK